MDDKFPTQIRKPGLLIVCWLMATSLLLGPVQPASANPNLPTDLSYHTDTTWVLPSLPHLSAASGYIPHNFSHGEAVFQLEGEVIHGFRPGKEYKEMYVRDIAWGMETAQYYYPDEYVREPIEAFLRRQYTAETRSLDGDFGVQAGAGAIGGIITARGENNKQTITSDEESSLIHAAYLYYTATRNLDWLRSSIDGLAVIERLNLAADWLYTQRLDPESKLIWRGHTTDWGDVKFEKSTNYTDYDPAQDHTTVSIYDQAMAYLAWSELAEMNSLLGDTSRAEEWRARAGALKDETNARLWQADRGFYRIHLHITPLDHDFDESAMVSISNALAITTGLADREQRQAILSNLERARLAAKADKPGLSLYPYYPNQWPDLFFDYLGMGYGNYQNGGVWDWWGGVQIKTEFVNGFAEQGTAHLLQVANDWAKHPGNIIEWQSTTDPAHHEGSHYYSAAAGTMGSAIIEGFFGIELSRAGLTIQPRLGLNDGFVRVYQPATDLYAAYRYDWDQEVTKMEYGTNAAEPVAIKILELRSQPVLSVTFDGQPAEFTTEELGDDRYVVLWGPSGQHSIELLRGAAGQPTATQAAPAVEDHEEGHASPDASPIENLMPPATDGTPAEQPPGANQSSDDLKNGAGDPEIASLAGSAVAAASPDEPQDAATGNAWETQLKLIQLGSTALVVFSALGLIGVIAVRPRRRKP
jgi:hypothetical protein